jgi:hypothetical protein
MVSRYMVWWEEPRELGVGSGCWMYPPLSMGSWRCCQADAVRLYLSQAQLGGLTRLMIWLHGVLRLPQRLRPALTLHKSASCQTAQVQRPIMIVHMLTLTSQQLPRERDQLHRFPARRWPEVPRSIQYPRRWLDRVKNPLRCWIHTRRQGGRQGQTDRPSLLAFPAWSLWSGRLLRCQDALDQCKDCDRSNGLVRNNKRIVRCRSCVDFNVPLHVARHSMHAFAFAHPLAQCFCFEASLCRGFATSLPKIASRCHTQLAYANHCFVVYRG